MRPSRIFGVFATEDAFLAALQEAVAVFTAENVRTATGYQVVIPGHHPFPTFAPRRRRLLSARQRTYYEPVTTAIIDFLVSRFDTGTMFDIGASTGYFSLLAASRLSGAPAVYSFEMMPSRFQRMRDLRGETPYSLWNWHPQCAAIADRHEGLRRIYFSRTRLFEEEPDPSQYREPWWRQVKFAMRGTLNRDRLQSAEVLFTSVDHFIQSRGVTPGVVKVDIDGYEGRFLDGALRLLRDHRPFVVLEIHKDTLIGRTGTTRRAILERFLDLGYRALMITEHNDIRLTRFVPLQKSSPEIERQQTDQVLLY